MVETDAVIIVVSVVMSAVVANVGFLKESANF